MPRRKSSCTRQWTGHLRETSSYACNSGCTPCPNKLFFRAPGFELVPGGIGNHAQVVEFSGAPQPLSAVNHHALSIDVFGHIAQKKCGEIGKLIMFAEALHGVFA